jgi:dihydroxy-acid dehydratase
MTGGTPVEFSTIGVCDGIAMNHEGMKYSLPSRELIADSVEVMARAHLLTSGPGPQLRQSCSGHVVWRPLRLNIPQLW